MSNENYFLEKLERMLFLEIKKGSKINEYVFKDDIYLPVNSDKIVSKAKEGDDLSNIPVNFFIEGMFYALGADKNFRFNHVYKEIIKSIPNSVNYAKGKIFENIKNEKYEDGYILLKGLLEIEVTTDNLNKAFILIDGMRKSNVIFKEEILKLIEIGKEIKDYPQPYYYAALVSYEDKDFEKAHFNIKQYISFGGNITEEVEELKENLDIINSFDKGKELVYEEPKKALEVLLPLIDVLGDSAEIFYYIAVSYRILQNYEKAIYYLNEALSIDSNYVQVFNELGINYACLNDFETAIKYLRKVFEVTKSIEVCTNLVMCYINIKDFNQAKIHLDIAKKLNPEDEIVKELENALG
ncbi:tetratricopeptide repeat protein [Clostridium sp.]|uniref:tetratricopeptide repeat protein n=1 Tax=Clostridium sp. TaxID=1506 RepID=UPI0032176A84